MKQRKPIHKTFKYTLVMTNGNKHSTEYTCSSYVALLERVSSDLEVYNVDHWRIDNVKHNY